MDIQKTKETVRKIDELLGRDKHGDALEKRIKELLPDLHYGGDSTKLVALWTWKGEKAGLFISLLKTDGTRMPFETAKERLLIGIAGWYVNQ